MSTSMCVVDNKGGKAPEVDYYSIVDKMAVDGIVRLKKVMCSMTMLEWGPLGLLVYLCGGIGGMIGRALFLD